MRDETDEREDRVQEQEHRKKKHQIAADIAVLEYNEKAVERKQDVVKEEIHRIKIEFARGEKALEEETRRRKTLLDRLTANLEKKEAELRPLAQELEGIGEDIKRVERQEKDL